MESAARAPLPDGTISRLIETYDWSTSPLGPRLGWSESLRTSLSLILKTHVQIVLFWGPDFIALYNDAYAPTIGDKHPQALGRPARENWAELWDDLEPLLQGVRDSGETYSAKDRPFYIERHGYGETVYFDISYSAVPDSDGAVGGVLCIVAETTERVMAERRLRESEERFRALVTASTDVVYRVSADWSELRQLEGRGFLKDADEPNIGWRAKYLLDEEQPTIQSAVDRAIANVEPLQVEHRVRRADGSIGWAVSRAVPIVDGSGKIVEWFGAATDITERKRADEHLRLVVNELNHRVKNNLAMVQSIAVQTFRNAEDLAQAKERFSARLIALAQANDLLTGERWAGASLRGATEQAVAPYRQEEDRLALAGPDVTLSPKTALALTLALHELATNAVKYGAWSNDSGRVHVEWMIAEPAPGQSRLRIEWSEVGGPSVSPPQRRGFGSRLIERGLAGEMDGEVTLSFAPEGLRCVVDAPLPRSSVG